MTEKISVIDFLSETKDDVNSPTTSTFTSKMSLCRATISALEECLDADRSALKKMKNSIKAMYNSGLAHLGNETTFIENLEKLGTAALYNSKEPESDIGNAFLKLSVFTKEISSLLKHMVSNINNILMFPLETLLKGDLKGVKGDMKRPFDKSWKDYDAKVKQVEREKRQLAKEAGMIRSEITGAEIAEEMEKERRMFQLQMCEYLIKANEIKTKKGVDFLQHLVEYYHAENILFSEGFKVVERFRAYADELTANLYSLRQAQDEEKRELVDLRNMLKLSFSDNDATGKTQANVYNLHQLQGNKALGNVKVGFLMKRSEGLRKAWQKRKCSIADGYLTMSHNKANKDPVKLNLLTSQLKLVSEDKRQFDLVSHNRTYRFMAEDEHDALNWVSVLTNSKDDALNRVFGDASSEKEGAEQNAGLKELTRSIIDEIRRLPGNDVCCDCGAPDPTWLSTNLGVLLCIECSGIHRDMGVHVSRIQSLTLDELGTSELLIIFSQAESKQRKYWDDQEKLVATFQLARSIGNNAFNNVMEEKLNSSAKLSSSSDMEERKSFIRGKYISRNYVIHTCNDDPEISSKELVQAIKSYDMPSLLQLFCENADLTVSLPGYEEGETALHIAMSLDSNNGLGSVLPLVDFLCQNIGPGLNLKTSVFGNTPLHVCAENNKTECMKLLLRSKANTDIENANGETALAIARRLQHTGCVELLEQANSGKFRPIVHIDIDWNLTFMHSKTWQEWLFNHLATLKISPTIKKLRIYIASLSNGKMSKAIIDNYLSNFVFDDEEYQSDEDLDNFSSAGGFGQSPMKTQLPEGRHRASSIKDRSKSVVDPLIPQLPSRPGPPPAVPPHQNLNRNRSQSLVPSPSLAEHLRSKSSSQPPPLPTKPDMKGRERAVSSLITASMLNRSNDVELKRAPPPEIPVKTAKPTKGLHGRHVSPSGGSKGRRLRPIRPKPVASSSFSKKLVEARGKVSTSSNPPDSILLSANSLSATQRQNIGEGNHIDDCISSTNWSGKALQERSSFANFKNCSSSLSTTQISSRLPFNVGQSSEAHHSPSSSKIDDEALGHKFSIIPFACTEDASSTNQMHVFSNPSYSNVTLHDQSQAYNTTNISRSEALLSNKRLNAPGKKTPAPFPSTGVQSTQSTRPATFSQGPDGRFKPRLPFPNPTVLDHRTGGEERSRSLPRVSNLDPDGAADLPPSIPPVPLPRAPAVPPSSTKQKRVRAIYNCEADNKDELTFVENEIIVVTGVEDQEWWVGHIEHQPHRSGVFPSLEAIRQRQTRNFIF